jgi:hypothetical protein
MQPIALYSAALMALGLFPVGHYLLFILDRAGLVDTAIILAHLSGFPIGALVALLGQASGCMPALTWLVRYPALKLLGLCSLLLGVQAQHNRPSDGRPAERSSRQHSCLRQQYSRTRGRGNGPEIFD